MDKEIDMTTQESPVEKDCRKPTVIRRSSADAVYGLGFVGACIYYVSTATTFWIGVLGILKSLVWPAFLVFELLKYLNM
jgi:hypothetical protein